MTFLSAFTEDTESQLTRLFDIAAKIWPFADFTKVRVIADLVDGANYRARYAAETAPYKDGGDPYTTGVWCYITALGWQYFYPDCLITADILIKAIKDHPDEVPPSYLPGL